MGTVTVEKAGLAGVTVRLSGVSDATATTDAAGQYAFSGLRMGSYSVEISGFDSDQLSFSSTASAVTVGVGESKIISFDGTYLRTAGIQGQVSVEGEGLAGVTVSLNGGPDGVSKTATTDASGQYAFASLRAGDYAVGISGYDTDDYEFEVTSQSVTVALAETATVPFEGTLLRTSGVSGRVSVEGMSLEDVTVTLSAAEMEDMTAMTDVGGLYAFTGLGAGEYTVAISGHDEDAYVFEAASMAVTVGDDDTQIVNFEGMHARTASVSGMLFVDEAAKNDSYDEGEDGLAAALVPLLLVGPGVNDQQPGATNEQGQFMFSGLRKGAYQLVVTITPAVQALLGDYAYGGSATGYELAVGVGEAVTQNIPFDITHQTVGFSVSLRSGDMMGDALSGATVTLYADLDGEDKIADGVTGDDGTASIRFPRADANGGSTVYAAVTSDDYHVAEGMQAVMWDPKSPVAAAANEADIVNLNVDVTFGGATITTAYGGGDPLAGWEISVMTGEDAVEGAPEELDDDGMASFEAVVEAGDLPVTYTFAVADDQDPGLIGGMRDTIWGEPEFYYDHGESFEANPLEYTHDGLSLAGTVTDMIEVRYTTQRLMVYVHHDRDQVPGFTGSTLARDVRDGDRQSFTWPQKAVTVDVRYIDDDGKPRSFTNDEWNASENTYDLTNGRMVFAGLPADANIVVRTRVALNDSTGAPHDIMILDHDELSTFEDIEENAVGTLDSHGRFFPGAAAFGAEGGFHHSVALCPLLAVDPTNQYYNSCSSFAYVRLHDIRGIVAANWVEKEEFGDDFSAPYVKRDWDGIKWGIIPRDGRNLAGLSASATMLKNDSQLTPWNDEYEFRFGKMPEGDYRVSVTAGWTPHLGFSVREDLNIDVRPRARFLYGTVTDSVEGFPMEDVTVKVNGLEVTTDEYGRYIARGFGGDKGPINPESESIWLNKWIAVIEVDLDGFVAKTDTIALIGRNAPTRRDIELRGAPETATISGTVRMSGTNEPVAGVQILVDGQLPLNSFKYRYEGTDEDVDVFLTDSDGNYTAIVRATEVGQTARVTAEATKAAEDLSFTPSVHPVSAIAGSNISGIDFVAFENATIRGRVIGLDNRPMSDVTVTATSSTHETSQITGQTGIFRLSVPWGTFKIDAKVEDPTISFEYVDNPDQMISVGPGQTVNFGDIQARSWAASSIEAMRGSTTTEMTVSWTAGTLPDGHTVMYQAQTKIADGDWTDFGAAVPADASDQSAQGTVPEDEIMVRVTSTNDNGTPSDTTDNLMVESEVAVVPAIAVPATEVQATRGLNSDGAQTLMVTWKATTNSDTQQRIVIRVGGDWLVADDDLAHDDRDWTLDIPDDYEETWTRDDGRGMFTVTFEDLMKALEVRVDARQGDDGDWVNGATGSVGAES